MTALLQVRGLEARYGKIKVSIYHRAVEEEA